MKIKFEGVTAFEKEFDTFDRIVNDYIDYADREGKTVPAHALEALFTDLSFWLLGVAASWFIDRRRGEQDKQSQQEMKAEIVSKLDALEEALLASQSARSEGLDGTKVVEILQAVHIQVEIELATASEADIRAALEAVLKDVDDVVVITQPATESHEGRN